ncbi:MAG: V-type ATP synthase subunit E [Deinococcota bacterium]|nr:V-type ATP synthase subunit E [Deinococcota bacterium]
MANLAALLDQEASAEIEAILSEAKHRASEIVAEAREKADAHLAQKARAAQVQYEASLVRAKSAAQLEASSLKLRSQYEAVERVFAETERRVSALIKDSKRYPPVFDKVLAEAIEALGNAQVAQIVVNPADRRLAEAFIKEKGLDLEIKTDPAIAGGVRVKAGGANVSVENSLPNRLARARQSVAGEVVQLLLGAGSSPAADTSAGAAADTSADTSKAPSAVTAPKLN